MSRSSPWPGRDWALAFSPQGLVGRPEGLVFALLSALTLVLVAVAELSAPGSVTVMAVGLVPIAACAWFLSHRLTITMVAIGAALRLLDYLAKTGDQGAVLTELGLIVAVAATFHLASVALVRWSQSERRADRLFERSEHATRLEKAKSEFLRLASHELRSPVGVLMGYLSMLEEGSLGELPRDAKAVMPLLLGRVREINGLVEQMLEIARLEDSRLQLSRQRVALGEVIEEALGNARYLAGARHRLIFDRPPQPVSVTGDRARLGAIVGNLVTNAIKYSPDGGDVRVRLRRNDGAIDLSVSDQGLGITAEERGKLFTRFGRIVRPETAGIPGTGLGLYLARELARLHGGDLTVDSEPGRGSTFTLHLPVVAAPVAAGPAGASPAARGERAPGRPREVAG